MSTFYRHTQVGYVTLGATTVAAIGLASITIRHHRPALWIGVALLVIIGVLFSSLTIEVGDGELRSHFGPGFWRKRWPLADVAGAELAPVHAWEGWGIRFTTRGMLYDVAGTKSVEVRMRSGTRFRLGSDEPEKLLDALHANGVA